MRSPKHFEQIKGETKSSVWSVFPEFILRSTGFPVDWIKLLCFDNTVNLFDQRYQLEKSMEDTLFRLKALENIDNIPNSVGLLWKKVRKKLVEMKPINDEIINCFKKEGINNEIVFELESYQKKIQLWEEICSKANEVFENELTNKQKFLQEIFTDKRLQEAVFQQSPSMYKNAVLPYINSKNHKRNSNVKRVERQLISYLQRLCTKNETTSFFGPIQYGSLDSGDKGIKYEIMTKEKERRAYMPYWAIEVIEKELIRCKAFTPYLCVKLSYQVEKKESQLYFPISNKIVKIPVSYLKIIEQLSYDYQMIKDLVHKISESSSEILRILEILIRKKIVKIGIPISITEPDALKELRNWIISGDFPVHPEVTLWRQRINWLWEIKESYANSPLEKKISLLNQLEDNFKEWTGEEARRLGGEIYADRNLLYEECHGPLDDIKIGGIVRYVIQEDVPKWLSLCAKHGEQKYRQQQELAKRIFKTLYQEKELVSFIKFIRDVSQHAQASSWEDEWKSIKTPVEAQIEKQVLCNNQEIVHLSSESHSFEYKLGWLASPDLMIAQNKDGTYEVILGEIHDTVMTWGWALQFHPEQESLEKQLSKCVQNSTVKHAMLNLLSNKRFKIVPFEYPGKTVQMNSISKSTNEKISLSQLRVVYTEEGLFLSLPNDDKLYCSYNGELDSMVHSFFALPKAVSFPIMTGKATPRIKMGNLVVQRAKWQIEKGAFWSGTYKGSSIELFYDAYRYHLQAALPREGFVKLPNQPKPVYVNFTNYFLLEMWYSFWNEREGCTFSEMLPDLSQLWLSKGDKKIYTAEMRLSYFCSRGV